MFKAIKDLLGLQDTLQPQKENKEMIIQEFPLFEFSNFFNHTMLEVMIAPVSDNNQKIKLYLPANMLDLIDLQMEDDFHVRFKETLNNIVINGTNKLKIEIPANHVKSINNYSMGSLNVSNGVEVQEKIINKGSGNITVDSFTGHEIKNTSMGDIVIKNIKTNNVEVSSNGSGNIEIMNGTINVLDSHTKSMGNVNINANIDSATISSNGSGNMKISNVSSNIDITLKSMGNINIEGSSTEKLIVHSGGSGTVKINDIHTKFTEVELKSMGNVEMVGQSLNSHLTSKGSGAIKGNFSSEELTVKIGSMGNIHVEPLKTLKAEIRGMGNLNLTGNHTLENVEVNLTSMGQVKGGNIKTQSLSVTGKTNQCNIELVSPSKKPKM